jgi:SagB-type dehydrogenase family enzyme
VEPVQLMKNFSVVQPQCSTNLHSVKSEGEKGMAKQRVLGLPQPQLKGGMSVEEVFRLRRTVRSFSDKDVDLAVVSQLLWALQGVTYIENTSKNEKVFHRTTPSAGRTYPLQVYAALPQSLYRYEPERHLLELTIDNDLRGELSEAAITLLNKEAIKTAPLTVILAADNRKALEATPLMENAVRFVHLEAGHAAQNLILQAVSLGLGVCTVTSYHVATVYEVLELPPDQRPIYILPIGFPKK